MNGGDNESDHSPLISKGEYTLVQDGDDNERLPWEFSDDEDNGDTDDDGRFQEVPDDSAKLTDRRLTNQSQTLTKALYTLGSSNTVSSSGGGHVNAVASYKRASSSRMPPPPANSAAYYLTATMAELRFTPKKSLSVETDNMTATTSTSPHDNRSIPDSYKSELRSPVMSAHRRKPSVSTLSTFQEFSAMIPWNELQPLDDLSSPLRLIAEEECNWSEICVALQDVRRLVLFHPEAADLIVRKDATMLFVIIPRILELIDNPRSLVSKNAITSLHDIFLFTPTHVPANLVYDCLHCILRRSTCSSYIADEAMRCLKQIVISGDNLRVLHTLMSVLSKQGRSYTTLRYVALYASGLFLLRLKAQALNAVLQHREFVSSFLKPILKATNDASQDCRAAAAQCCVIMGSMMPDFRLRFKNIGSEVDIGACMNRAARLYKPAADVFKLQALADAYATCPDHAPIELSIDRLQTAMRNIEEISEPHLSPSGSMGGGNHESPYTITSRSVTPGASTATLSPNTRTRAAAGGTMSAKRPAYRTSPPAGGGAFSAVRGITPSTRSQSSTRSLDRLSTPISERLFATATPAYSNSRLSFDTGDSRKRPVLNTRAGAKRAPAIEEFDDCHVPAYALRGNFRYSMKDESRLRRGL